MTQSVFVSSGYERLENDDYQTIDPRCIQALLESWEIDGDIVDCCSLHGSKIVNELIRHGRKARGIDDALSDFSCDWIVTNPPYSRPLVDDIMNNCVSKLRNGEVRGVAALMRANWDFAKSRANLFQAPWYNAEIKMRFRPWWTKNRDASPVHNFVWHIWEQHTDTYSIKRYWPA